MAVTVHDVPLDDGVAVVAVLATLLVPLCSKYSSKVPEISEVHQYSSSSERCTYHSLSLQSISPSLPLNEHTKIHSQDRFGSSESGPPSRNIHELS